MTSECCGLTPFPPVPQESPDASPSAIRDALLCQSTPFLLTYPGTATPDVYPPVLEPNLLVYAPADAVFPLMSPQDPACAAHATTWCVALLLSPSPPPAVCVCDQAAIVPSGAVQVTESFFSPHLSSLCVPLSPLSFPPVTPGAPRARTV